MHGDTSELVKTSKTESIPWGDEVFSSPGTISLDLTPLFELGELSAGSFLPVGKIGQGPNPAAGFSQSLPGGVSRVRGRSPSPYLVGLDGGSSVSGGAASGGGSRSASGGKNGSSSPPLLPLVALDGGLPLDREVDELIDSLLTDPNETMLENLLDLTDDNFDLDSLLDTR